jgi:membrane-bound lytic murein transglycosylase D
MPLVTNLRGAVSIFFCVSLGGCVIPPQHTQPSATLGPLGSSIAYSPSSSTIAEKVASLPSVPLDVTPEVKREIDYFLNRDPLFIVNSLERRKVFYPMLVQVFRDEGLPVDLINVALIESGYRPDARSRAGAVGLWQFMKPTARLYGLKVMGKVDQRKDPILSTLAAARHLRDLYMNYRNWYLALGAYNAGVGGIDRAMIKAHGDDFWELCRKRKVRLQTARYVPRIIAATLLVNKVAAAGEGDISMIVDDLRRTNQLGLLFGKS